MTGKATTLSLRESEVLLFLPLDPRSPLTSDNHAKCDLRHYLHLFTLTNYIPLKLPRKICQKNVITPSWNVASSEISSLPFCKESTTGSHQAKCCEWQLGPSWAPEVLPEACPGLGVCRWAGWSSRRLQGWALEDLEDGPCQASSGGGAVWWLVATACWNLSAGSGAATRAWGFAFCCGCFLQWKVGCPV